MDPAVGCQRKDGSDDAASPAAGAVVVPDVLLVPCVGFAAGNYRLGYGGGYFDRYLARHPHVTTMGVAWSSCASARQSTPPAATSRSR